MSAPIKIDFVSDVSCPWCAIGLNSLEQALARLDGDVKAEIHFQPFELNPQMPPAGQDINEHLAEKYGATPEQSAADARDDPRARRRPSASTSRMDKRGRIYNTFDAHRLLHWAELEGAPARAQARPAQGLFHRRREPGRARGADRASPAKSGWMPRARKQSCHRTTLPTTCARQERFYLDAWHPRGAGGDRQRAPPDPGRTAGRSVRTGAAQDRGGGLDRMR